MAVTLFKIAILLLFCSVCIASAALLYLVQPAGKLTDFKTWQASANTHPIHQGSELQVRFFGVSTLLFDDGQQQILIDGFFSRPSLWQLISTKIQSDHHLIQQLKADYDLQRTRAILVTHSHYDHALDLATLAQQLPQSKIIGSKSSLTIAASAGGIHPNRLQLVHPDQAWQFGSYRIRAFKSAHTPATAVNNDLGQDIQRDFQLPAKFSEFKEGGSYDYLLQHGSHNILVKASTGFVPQQLQGLNVDILFLGIAQLSKQPKDYQQRYLAETLLSVKPKVVIPIHWDDFFQPLHRPMQFLPRFADHAPASLELLIQAAKQQHIKLVLINNHHAHALASLSTTGRLR